MTDTNQQRDLVLAPNEFAYILDTTKGNINVYVGPNKTSLANTDKPIIFNPEIKRFENCSLSDSIQVFATAPEGWYMVLKNPPKDGNPPRTGASNVLAELNIGTKVNIPGPISFALWAGQMVRVIQGHLLRSNQYLIVRVYDEKQAQQNWSKAVIKIKKSAEEGGEEAPDGETPNLTMGKLLVIKGVHVSFYIPPTGVEVVRDEYDNYVREAVTLERMEYCILKDEDGNKRYVRGPAVVFPEPTEEFIERDEVRKFKAIELNEISGLYVKVIAPYTEKGVEYKEGDELFITGKDQAIYYPRPEHAIIRYGDKEKNYAVVIPAGEGRYYLNRKTGTITLQRGPSMFLPDPRSEVLVRRLLDPGKVSLYYPGNQEALEYNLSLQSLPRQNSDSYIEDQAFEESFKKEAARESSRTMSASPKIAGSSFERSQKFTPPRTITIDSKYEGAVTINIWTGYAVLVVSKTGARKVVVGPETLLLEYDETLQPISLSSGTPKTDEHLIRTVYLQSLYNKISDVVECESKDLCRVHLYLSYRVNFEGAPEKWFNVENYVKFLTEHLRSFLRNLLKRHTISEFYANAIDFIRDAVLGKSTENGKRSGRAFEENGMRIYDIEVLDVRLGDEVIEKMVIGSQHEVIKQNLTLETEKRKEEYTETTEKINQKIAELRSNTRQKALELETTENEKMLSLTLGKIEAERAAENKRLEARLFQKAEEEKINTLLLAVRRAQDAQELETEKARVDLQVFEQNAEAEALVKKAQAVSPELIAALQAFSDRALAAQVAESIAPLSILGGKSVAEVFANMLKGTALGNVLNESNITPTVSDDKTSSKKKQS